MMQNYHMANSEHIIIITRVKYFAERVVLDRTPLVAGCLALTQSAGCLTHCLYHHHPHHHHRHRHILIHHHHQEAL